MSTTALFWLALFGMFTTLSFARPAYGVSLYLLTYFALPDFWWWGKGPLGGYRWTLVGGLILLTATLMRSPDILAPCRQRKIATTIILLMMLNCTIVQFGIANASRTVNDYFLDIKLFVLFLAIVHSIRDTKDLKILVLSLILGIGYLGYEVTINGRGRITHGRLEGIGIPGASAANDLGSLIITLLPLAGGLTLAGRGWIRLVAAAAGGLAFNIILLCNSRGGFLALIGSGIVLGIVSTGKERKFALRAFALAGLACLVFLGDPKIIDRFQTTFVGDEERDTSAASRLSFWKAGFAMIKDHPLGSGAEAFKKNGGGNYLRREGVDADRAVHNGYINDAIQWGVQGLALRLSLFLSSILAMYRMRKYGFLDWVTNERFLAICVMGGLSGLMISSLFGNFIDREVSFLLMAVPVSMCQVISNLEASEAGGRSPPTAGDARLVPVPGEMPVAVSRAPVVSIVPYGDR